MKVVHCSRCGAFIGKDDLRYIVGVHVTLDTDGFSDTRTVSRLVAGAADCVTADETLAEVFSRDMAFTLCKPCRDHFVQNPLDRMTLKPDWGFVQ